MGSTALVVIHFRKNNCQYLNIMNTGDCRAVLCRDHLAIALTKDHKPEWPEERRRIEKMGGRIQHDGIDWRIKDLSVSRAFGDLDATPFVTHRPDIYRYKMDKSDKFMILACDGLWDTVSPQEGVNFVLANCYDSSLKKKKKIPDQIARKLAEYAIMKGSGDNVSVIIVFFN